MFAWAVLVLHILVKPAKPVSCPFSMKTALFFALAIHLNAAPFQTDLDQQLVGTWIYTDEKSTGSGATFINHVTKIKWLFRTDGTFEKGASQTQNAGQSGNGWSEAFEKGTWRTREGQLLTPMVNSQLIPVDNRRVGTYYIEGGKMVFTGLDGKKAIWRKEIE